MKSTRAFSLVEVLIGSCVLLFILFPAFLSINQAGKMLVCARMNTDASSRLQTLVEDFRAMNFSDINAYYFTGKAQPVDLTALMGTEGFSGSKYYSSVYFTQPAGRSDFLQADFSISWTDGFGHIQTRVFHTRFSKNGLSDQVLQGL